MSKSLWLALVLGALTVSIASPARGEDESEKKKAFRDRIFVDVNFGYQTDTDGFSYRDTQSIFLEEASAELASSGKSDVLYDVGGGVRLFDNLGVGISYSRYQSDLDGVLEVSIPHPFLFDAHGTGSLEVPLARKESAIHLSAVYVIPVTGNLQVGLRAGPSRFTYEQDGLRNFRFELNPRTFRDFDVELMEPEIATLKGSTWGYHVGADVTYLFSRHVGVGGMVRYSRASTAVENALEAMRLGRENTSASLDLGGLQLLVGLRLRF